MSDISELEEGSLDHINKIMENTEKVEYEYDGHYYWFEYQTELDWESKMELVLDNLSDSADVDDLEEVSEQEIDIASLYQDLLRKQVVDSNIDKVSVLFTRLPDELGTALGEDIVQDVGLFDESDRGNLKKL